MFGQIFLTSCLVMMTSCWRIDVSNKNVALQLSLNVTLDCRNHDDNDNNSQKLADITKLMILKRNPDNQWVSLAKVERNTPNVETSLQNVMLTGNALNPSDSFIKLQFPFATDDAIGQFVCEVEGYYSGDKKLKHVVKTKPVVIIERDATFQDMLKVIGQFKQQDKTKNIKDYIMFVLLQKMINIHHKDIKSITQADSSQVWPAGNYALIKPKTGCPFSLTFDWQYSRTEYASKSGKPHSNKMSSPSHLLPDTFTHKGTIVRNFVNIRLCSKTLQSEGPAWPRGAYCIHKYHLHGGCPKGFYAGFIGVGTDNFVISTVVNLPATRWEGVFIQTDFCCRNDADANHPIRLPSKDPFYLLRKGGTCQKVKGMDVSNEWIQIASTKHYDESRGSIPDGHMRPVRFELCYYTPSI